MADNKQWAQQYLRDSQGSGPTSHFVNPASNSSSVQKASSSRHSSSSPHSKHPSVRVTPSPPQYTAYPSPPASASPTKSSFHSSNPYASRVSVGSSSKPPSSSSKPPSTRPRSSTLGEPKTHGRRRGSSLGERFAGDMSHRPLDQIRQDTKKANRAPHLKKKALPGADVIDSLDSSMLGGAYHHEGPYDATLLSRNLNVKYSPVAATESTNAEALKATPRENIRDALDRHVPLQGVAVIPPGMLGPDGKPMEYEEGADLMREEDAAGGAYKRWDGIQYHPEDYKGKGEPSFTIERALKEQKKHDHRRVVSDGGSAYEMQAPRSRPSGTSSNGYLAVDNAEASGSGGYENEMQRSKSTGGKMGGLKKRFGSIRRGKKSEP